MQFNPTNISDVYLIEIEPHADERGFFARTWCKHELEKLNLDTDIHQCNLSLTKSKGTIRGLHYQIKPHDEVKIVRCIRGAVFDVIIDLRPQSPSYLQQFTIMLCEDKYRSIYIPKGCAHGFQTTADNTEMIYHASKSFDEAAERGIRWNDPAFNIDWPLPISHISSKDNNYPNWHSN